MLNELELGTALFFDFELPVALADDPAVVELPTGPESRKEWDEIVLVANITTTVFHKGIDAAIIEGVGYVELFNLFLSVFGRGDVVFLH